MKIKQSEFEKKTTIKNKNDHIGRLCCHLANVLPSGFLKIINSLLVVSVDGDQVRMRQMVVDGSAADNDGG
ncbi:hypothetical protein DERF_000865 [Dermatophagoides farinae]|uniref:Uncharacterized protein n=1 Tax=Dermatophagoides farinae TaxID=6954 RepID=A0A922IDT5_DERFA|nr:hypothetical protein DERF_000865 [Dermatophagoides farinae]